MACFEAGSYTGNVCQRFYYVRKIVEKIKDVVNVDVYPMYKARFLIKSIRQYLKNVLQPDKKMCAATKECEIKDKKALKVLCSSVKAV